jgi:hypothetical protein
MTSEISRPPQNRPISTEEAMVLGAAFQCAPKIPDAASHLVSAIASCGVVSRCGCGCDSVDFERRGAPGASCIVADGVGTTPSGGEVGVLVWASGDVITGLEVYDLGAGDDDITLPVPNSIHGWGSAKT